MQEASMNSDTHGTERIEAALRDACDEMAEVIRIFELPQNAVRRVVSFEVAEFIYNGEPLKARHE